eukprot:TRINITY_DN14204_c0_g1_i1.p1 TRINITY_DN14204_c0_g1~~TRINITY_DN14204_c0_g1_i1.p1  ORF type:complete len:629 (+),score=151.16 TRINITY_DN14204_c0_g1_i1:88-1974(+)
MKTAALMLLSAGVACMASDTHTCDGKVLPKDMVNDDYCDCTDGSDEPRTSACAGLEERLTYWCENEGHKGKMVSQSQINDGICDCCDGSDEFATTAGCVNNCIEVATVYAKEEARLKAIRDEGLARKAELVAEAKRLIAEKQGQKQQWTEEKAILESDLANAAVIKSTQEAIEQSERDEIKRKSEEEKALWEHQQVQKKSEADHRRVANTAKHTVAVQTFGAVTVGGEVELITDLKFTSGSTAREGLSGTVLTVLNEESGTSYGISLVNGVKFKTTDVSHFRPKAAQVPKEPEKVNEPPQVIEAAYQPCVGWQQTAGCDPEGAHEITSSCGHTIEDGSSGYCECRPTPAPQGEIVKHKFTCSHKPFTCQYVCEMNGVVGDAFDQPCPDTFPYPVVSSGSEFFGKVCYNSKENAEAGSGPCGTWCARDAVWFEQHRCTWGCECGDMCDDNDDDEDAANTETHFESVDTTEETFTVDTGISHTRQEATTAREEYNSIQSKVSDLEGKISSVDKELETNYGPDSVFLPLKGKCVEYTTPEYVYKLCPFDKVTQGHTSMGNWESWGTQTYGSWGGQDDLTIQKYTNGQGCWSGPARSTEVRVVCGAESTLGTVAEPSMCTYTMVWHTPAACV